MSVAHLVIIGIITIFVMLVSIVIWCDWKDNHEV